MSDINIPTGNTPDILSTVKAIKVEELVGSRREDYELYETITQTYEDTTDPSIKYVAKGTLIGWDDEKDVIRYIQDPKIHSDAHGKLYEFTGDAPIYGTTSEKTTIPDITFNLTIDLMSYKDGYSIDEVNKYVGSLDYVTNISPVVRSPFQTERVSLIISY